MPSKNYVTARGEEVDVFVTYRYVYLEGGGGILRNSYVTANIQFENSKSSYLVSLERYGIVI